MSRNPLVLLHGFMGSEVTFAGFDRGISRKLIPVGIPLPADDFDEALSSGHEAVARQILEGLDARGVNEFALLGYSMGGRVAMHIAALAPDRVERLILESAHPGLDSEQEREMRRRHDAAWAIRIRTEWPRVLEDWYNQSVFSSLSPTLRERLIQEKRSCDPEEAALTLESLSLGRQRPLWQDIADFHGPTLFISGEMDQRYQQVGERLAAHPGPIRHLSLKGAGHVVHREQPEAYLDALESFLSLESSPER